MLGHYGNHIHVEGDLPPADLAILEALLRLKDRAIANAPIENYLNKGAGLSSNTTHIYIHRLRKLLEHVGATVKIKTVKGIGYMIKETR